MKREYNSILEIENGLVMAKTDQALNVVQDSFNDPDHDPKGKAKIVIELILQEDESGTVYITNDVKRTLCPTVKHKTVMAKGRMVHPVTGEISTVFREINGQARGQLDVFGDINEPAEVIVGIGRISKEEIELIDKKKEEGK